MTTEVKKQLETLSATDDATGRSDFELLAIYLEADFGNIYEYNMNGGEPGLDVQEWTDEIRDAIRSYLLKELPDDVASVLFGLDKDALRDVEAKQEAVGSLIASSEPWEVALEVREAAVKSVPTLDQLIGHLDTWPYENERMDVETWLETHVSDADLKEMALWLGVRNPTVWALTHDHEPSALVEAWKYLFDPGPAPSDLTDDEWELFKPFLPPATKWAPWTENRLDIARRVLNGMLYRYHKKTTWALIPRRYGAYEGILMRRSRYKKNRIFKRALDALDGTPGAERLVEWLRTEERHTSSSHVAT